MPNRASNNAADRMLAVYPDSTPSPFATYERPPALQTGRDPVGVANPQLRAYWSRATMSNISDISVILANFNHSRFVEVALRALISQIPAPAEIVVVDDASTDESVATIRRIAAENPSIRLIENSENIGVIRAQKLALEVATGHYIYFAASDDWVIPGFFALAMKTLANHPQAGFFCGDAVLVNGETSRFIGYRPVARPFYRAGAASAEEARAMLRRFDNWILTSSTILRRDALDAAGGLNGAHGSFADGHILRKIAVTSGFCYAPQVVSGWRIFSSGQSRQTALNPEKATEALHAIPAKISSDPAFPTWYPELFRRRWQFATSRVAIKSNPINYAVLDAMASNSSLDAWMLRRIRLVLARVPSLERLVTLMWLSVRLRPYPLSGLIASKLSRLWRKQQLE